MKLFKKVTGCILATATVLATGLGLTMLKEEPKIAKAAPPSTIDEFLIGSWQSIYDYGSEAKLTEQIADYARSGLNLFMDAQYGAPEFNQAMKNIFGSVVNGDKYLNEVCGDNGIKFMSMYDNTGKVYGDDEMENLVFYHVKDEPAAATFDSLAATVQDLYAADPSRAPFVNMYPDYAGTANLGGTYEDYVRGWVNTVGADVLEYLYFDYYPFSVVDVNNGSYRQNYWHDIEVIRKVAYENGRMKTGGFTQMGEWNGMYQPNEDMARWSVYSLLSYGMKSISHYCWVSPRYVSPANGGEGSKGFVINEQGQPTALYQPMQILNWQTRQLGQVLMGLDCSNAYHTLNNVPQGVSVLPDNFLVKPNGNEDMLVSLFESKTNDDKYLMFFNKSYKDDVNASFTVAENSGIEGMTYLKPTEYTTATLPNPKTLEGFGSLTKESISIQNGEFIISLKPGEGKLVKLEGDINVVKELSVPTVNLKSGVYENSQQVSITTPDKDVEIYYSLDGSYPKQTEENRYTGSITLGKDGEYSRHLLRFYAVRGEEIGQLCEYEYIVIDGARNVAFKKPVALKTLNMAADIGYKSFEEKRDLASVAVINDGSYSNVDDLQTVGAPGWAIIDFGKEEVVDRIIHVAWGNWAFEDVVIQLSTTADFSSNVTTIFNNDKDNSVGAGAGEDGSYQEGILVGDYYAYTQSGYTNVFDFAPTTARYLRATNRHAWQGEDVSIWTEIAVFTAYEKGKSFIQESGNLARGIKPTLKTMDMQGNAEAELFNETQGLTEADLGYITDDVFALETKIVRTKGDTRGWAVIDLGEDKNIGGILTNFWGNWKFNDVVIQLSASSDFTSGVTTVYNNDTDGSVGVGVGTDGDYLEDGYNTTGHYFPVENISARYVRVTNSVYYQGEFPSIFTEIQVYGANSTEEEWKVTGESTSYESNWVVADGAIKLLSAANNNAWNRSYTYTVSTFKDFVITGKFTILQDAGGFVGFGLYKPRVEHTQNDVNKGIYACVSPQGDCFFYRGGGTPGEVGEHGFAAGVGVGSEFTLTVTSIGDFISISVNGKTVCSYSGPRAELEAGYISINASCSTVAVKDLSLLQLDADSLQRIPVQAVMESVEPTEKIALEQNANESVLVGKLPTMVAVKDTGGAQIWTNVAWDLSGVDYQKVGVMQTVYGEFTDLGEMLNVFNLQASVEVFVKPTLDKTDFLALLAVAEKINLKEFTKDSAENFKVKLAAARSVNESEFSLQNDVGVVHFQLDLAMKGLERIEKLYKASLAERYEEYKGILADSYTEDSYQVFDECLARAKDVLAYEYYSEEEIMQAEMNLIAAYWGLEEKETFEEPPVSEEPPTSEEPSTSEDKPGTSSTEEERGCMGSVEASAIVGLCSLLGMAVKKKKDNE